MAKIIQITASGNQLYGLDSDGVVWTKYPGTPYGWSQLLNPPTQESDYAIEQRSKDKEQ